MSDGSIDSCVKGKLCIDLMQPMEKYSEVTTCIPFYLSDLGHSDDNFTISLFKLNLNLMLWGMTRHINKGKLGTK